MQIQIIAVGRIKEPYLADGIAEYEKRLRPYAKVRITEVAEEKRPAHPSPAQQAQALEKEGARIVGLVPDGIYLIALDVRGEQVSSEGLAALLQDREISGNSSLVFILGGDLGLSENVLNRSHLRLSLSPMTFTHPMVRLILLEQVYRAFRIMRGEPYHK